MSAVPYLIWLLAVTAVAFAIGAIAGKMSEDIYERWGIDGVVAYIFVVITLLTTFILAT